MATADSDPSSAGTESIDPSSTAAVAAFLTTFLIVFFFGRSVCVSVSGSEVAGSVGAVGMLAATDSLPCSAASGAEPVIFELIFDRWFPLARPASSIASPEVPADGPSEADGAAPVATFFFTTFLITFFFGRSAVAAAAVRSTAGS